MSLTRGDSAGLYGQSVLPERLRDRFVEGDVPVAVYGLGKMGLPIAAVYAATTGNVVGVDIDEAVVDRVNAGECPVDNEPRLPYLVSTTVESGALRATVDAAEAARDASVHVVIVPTTVDDDHEVDLSALRAAVVAIGEGLTPGDLVVIESTVPPGTCTGLVRPLLERESGLDVGDFGIAFCPERSASGRAVRDIRGAYPKVIGGIDEESARAAEVIYGEISGNRVVPVADATTAECVKVFEGVYRDVNIALANELARATEELGIDVREAIDVANTQPYCEIHDPGPGVGGHCIPYYPYFLIRGLDTETPLLRTARAVNDAMPAYTADRVLDGLAEAGIDPWRATVAVLGVAYRPGVRETRESPALPLIDRLEEAGARVLALDPLIDDLQALGVESTTVDALPEHDVDAVVSVTPHEAFERIDWAAVDAPVVVDGRDALDPEAVETEIYTLGSG